MCTHSAFADGPLLGGPVVFGFHAGGFGGEVVEGVVGAELDGMVGSGCVVEVGTSQNVADAGLEDKGEGVIVVVVSVHVFFGYLEFAAVTGVGSTEVHEEFGRELVVPAQAAHNVAPVVTQSFMALVVVAVVHPVAGIEVVVAHVVGSIEAAALVEAVGDFGVEVVKVVASVDLGILAFGSHSYSNKWLQENVAIGASSRHREGGLFLHYRSFDIGFGRDEPHTYAAVNFFVVTVVGGDVEHRRQTAAETGRETALVELDVLHGIRVESREETAEVVHVVHGDTVKHEQVLVGATTAYIHARHSFVAVLHTGQKLDGLNHVCLAKEHGNGPHLFHGYFDAAGDGTLYVLGAFAYYLYYLKRACALQFGIEALIATEV